MLNGYKAVIPAYFGGNLNTVKTPLMAFLLYEGSAERLGHVKIKLYTT
jgi:hypothetical protein